MSVNFGEEIDRDRKISGVFEIKRDIECATKKSIKRNKNIKRNKRIDAGKMLLLYMLLFLPVFVAAQGSQSIKTLDREVLRNDSRGSLDWIGESFLNTVDTFFPISKSCNEVEGRKDKKLKKLNKYIIPLIIGFLLIKSILLPITLKALAILSGKAVVLSLMSLILAAIIGLKKVAQKESSYESSHKYRRQDVYGFVDDVQEFEPYRFYKERRRRK